MKSWKVLGVSAFAACALLGGTAMAATHTGTVTLYHLNKDVAGRGPCVQMAPAVPGTGWACLWKSSQLYPETRDLLLHAYLDGKTCTVVGNPDPNGHLLISIAECR